MRAVGSESRWAMHWVQSTSLNFAAWWLAGQGPEWLHAVVAARSHVGDPWAAWRSQLVERRQAAPWSPAEHRWVDPDGPDPTVPPVSEAVWRAAWSVFRWWWQPPDDYTARLSVKLRDVALPKTWSGTPFGRPGSEKPTTSGSSTSSGTTR